MGRERSPHSHGRSELRERPQLQRALRRELRALGARLRALRLELELTQEEAAERIGVHPKHLQRIENGAVNVTLATLVAAACSYRVGLRDLFGR